MTPDDAIRTSPVSASPIEDFSNCHLGILTRLDALAELPALADAARRSRTTAQDLLSFFDEAVLAHHVEEERDLFPAVLASAVAGAERDSVAAMTERLTREHRDIEHAWSALKPALKAIAKGRDADLDAAAVQTLVDRYRQHAGFEEQAFLPLSQQILGRNDDHMAALGAALHLRHVLPDVLRRYGGRI